MDTRDRDGRSADTSRPFTSDPIDATARRFVATEYGEMRHPVSYSAPQVPCMSPYLPGSPPTAPLAPVAAYLPATDSYNLTQYGEITAYDDPFYGHDQSSTTQVDNLEWNYTELRYHEHHAPSLDMTLSSDSLLCVAGLAYGEAGVMYDQFPHGSTSWDTGATNVDGRMPILAGAPMDHQTPWGSSTTWCYCATCRNFEETSISHPNVGVPYYHYYSADQNNYVDSEPPTPPPAGSELRIPPICRWEGCNVLLDDSSPSGVKRHLYDYHDVTRADCASGARGNCKWDIDGAEPCGRALDLSSFAKHVASVHLKSTQRRCEDCRCMIGRADSLTRHQRDHCAARRDWQLEGWV